MKERSISAYGQFMIDSVGYIFVDRKTGKVVEKWLVYNTFGDDVPVLTTINVGTHSRYIRMQRVDEIKEKQFNF